MTDLQYFKPSRVVDMVGEEYVAEILRGYIPSMSQSLESLRAHWLARDTEQVRILSHRLKSSTRLIGADKIADEFQKIEVDSKLTKVNICAHIAILNSVEMECNNLKKEIELYLESTA